MHLLIFMVKYDRHLFSFLKLVKYKQFNLFLSNTSSICVVFDAYRYESHYDLVDFHLIAIYNEKIK